MVILMGRLNSGIKWNAINLETNQKYYRVDRGEIAYLRFIFEAYDGIAVVKTIDAPKGLIVLHIAPGCDDDVEYVLQDLKKDIMIETVHV